MEFPFMWRIYEAGTSTFSDFSTRSFAFRSVVETLDYVVDGNYEYNKYTFHDLTAKYCKIYKITKITTGSTCNQNGHNKNC